MTTARSTQPLAGRSTPGNASGDPHVLGLRPAETVRVRSAAEIYATLDDEGTLDGLPFMPEMLKYCGQVLPVVQRADKTCAGKGVVRRMHNTVHLRRTRCDGAAHGGCQAACLMFWKEAWLERVETNGAAPAPSPPDAAEESLAAERLMPATTVAADSDELRYRCQATEIPRASSELRFREFDQYVGDVRNWGLGEDRPRPRDRALQPLPVVPQAAAA